MAIIWSRERDGVRYEVRNAGRTRRLYTDGVFHSSFNPARPLTGGVWDLLMMPAFLYPPGAVQRVLLLGVGGGTVIRQLRAFVRPLEIVAVDRCAEHLYVARRYFGVAGPDVSLVEADARDWMRQDRSRYDLVIDDLFAGSGGEPQRAIEANVAWCNELAAHTSRNGAIAINCLSPYELAQTGLLNDDALRRRFPGRFRLRAARDQNAVGLFLPRPVQGSELRRNLEAVPGLNPRRERQLNFSLRTLR